MPLSGATINPNYIWVGLLAMTLIAIFYIFKLINEPKKPKPQVADNVIDSIDIVGV
jgi:bacteriorhodopsin